MKLPVLFLLGLAVLSAPSVAPAQATGKEAMRIVGRDRGADYLPRMLHLFGQQGVPQPAVWRVVARDGKGAVREFYVSKGAIISEGIIPPAKANGISGTPLPMHRLNIDSKAAFEKAEAAARTAKVGFDHLNYQLRCLELSTNAAWFIALEDAQGNRVGEVSVGASTGTLISQNWFRTPKPTASAPCARPGSHPTGPTRVVGPDQGRVEPGRRGRPPRDWQRRRVGPAEGDPRPSPTAGALCHASGPVGHAGLSGAG